MSSSKKSYDVYTINLMLVGSSFVFSLFLLTQNFQNIFTLSLPLSLSASSKQILTTIQTAYFPPLIVSLVTSIALLTIVIFVRIFFRKVSPASIGYTISLVVIILDVILTSILLLLVQLSQQEFSPVSVLQNTWAAPITQLITLSLSGGSLFATLITIIDYRKHRSV